MPSIYQLMSNTRRRLRTPRAQRPSDAEVLQQVCSHTQNLANHLQNTGNAWDFHDTVIGVVPSVDTYQIGVNNFGKPLAVLTSDSNPAHFQRIIPFYCPQNLVFDWGLPQNWGAYTVSYDGSNHTAQRCAFFWRSGVPYIQFQPIPLLSCQYLVRYSVGAWVDAASLSQEPSLPQYHDLIECRAARSLLPFTEWDDDESRNQNRRKELALTLTADGGMFARQFEAGALTQTGPVLTNRWYPPE